MMGDDAGSRLGLHTICSLTAFLWSMHHFRQNLRCWALPKGLWRCCISVIGTNMLAFTSHLNFTLRQRSVRNWFLATQRRCIVLPVRYELNLYMLCRRPPLWSSGQSSWLHSRDVLWFLWRTNWIYICFVEESSPSLWYSGRSSWLLNGDLLYFLWGTNWIYKLCRKSRPPLWSSGQSS
jgi:hypothetical protein